MNDADRYIIITRKPGSKGLLIEAIISACFAIGGIVADFYAFAVFPFLFSLSIFYLFKTSKNHKMEQIIIDRTGIRITERKRKFLWKDINSIRVERHLPVGSPRCYIIITTSVHKRYKIFANNYDIDFAKFKSEVNRLSGKELIDKKYIDKL